MRRIHTIMLAIVMLTVASCSQAQNKNNLSAQSFSQAIAQKNNAVVLDVRTPEEYAEGHIKGAKNINWHDEHFTSEVKKLDKEKPVYVYCHSGRRSAEAAAAMRKNGFKQVYELDGGIVAWTDAGMATE